MKVMYNNECDDEMCDHGNAGVRLSAYQFIPSLGIGEYW